MRLPKLRVLLAKAVQHLPALGSISVRMLGILLGFVTTFLIGRWWGAEANGLYALVTQTAAFLAVLAIGGLDLSIVRHFAAPEARRRRPALSSLLKLFGLATALTVVATLFMLLLGLVLGDWLGIQGLTGEILVLLCALALSRGLGRAFAAVLQSQHRYILGQFIGILAIPAVVTIALAAGLCTSVEQAIRVTAFAGLASIVLGALLCLSAVRRPFSDASTPPDTEEVPVRPMLRTAFPLWTMAIALNVADWYSLVVIASMLGVYEVGLFRVAMQVGTALSIISTGLFAVYSAPISIAHASGNQLAIARIARTATRISALLILPAGLILILLGGPILGLIGEEFRAADTLLHIVVAGQIVYTILGVAGVSLSMTGNERSILAAACISTAFLFVSVPIAAWLFGITGGAICIAAAQVGRDLSYFLAARRKLGINVFTGKIVRLKTHQ